MTRKKSLWLILAVNLCLLLATVLWIARNPPLSTTCEGSLTFRDKRENSGFNFEGMVSMHFHPEGSGTFMLNGQVATKTGEHHLSRQEQFTWRHVHHTQYEITITHINRFTHDEVPDGVLEKFVGGIGLGQKRPLKIFLTPDKALVIGDVYSPLLLCPE